MPVITGKTGADAIFRALNRICIVIKRFRAKLIAVVAAAQLAGAITAAQATAIIAFITASSDLCDAFSALADYSGVVA